MEESGSGWERVMEVGGMVPSRLCAEEVGSQSPAYPCDEAERSVKRLARPSRSGPAKT